MSAATLSERAAQMANGEGRARQDELPVSMPAEPVAQYESTDTIDELGDEDYPTPAQVPVHVAWHRVMCDVRAIAKNRRVTSGPAKFAFRGVEDVVQAFSASVRRHGVIIAPAGIAPTYTTSSSKQGTVMRECTAVCNWSVIGPMGDVLPVPLQTAGEAADYSDKATTKAQSIAHRTLLLELGLVATNDPEPEAESAEIERGDPSVPTAQAYLTEITNPYTSRERFRQIWNELGQHRLLAEVVEFEGASGTLRDLYAKIGKDRWPKPKPATPQHNGHPDGVWTDGCEGCAAESREIEQRDADGGA